MPLLSFPRDFIVFYGVKQVPQHLSATLQREAARSPARWEREAKHSSLGFWDVRAPRVQRAIHGKCWMVAGGEGERSRRRTVFPLTLPPAR